MNLIKEKFPNVSWGHGKQNGPAGNRNAGVARAKGKWIVFLDDDCIAQENYLSEYAKAINSNPNYLVFEGRIFADRQRRTWAEGCPENEQGGMLWTSNLCVSRELFNKMGGLDERFAIAYEDVDFALRLKKQNTQSYFVYSAGVCHPWRTLRNGGKNWKKRGYHIQELLIFLSKHPDQYPYHSQRVFVKNALRGIIKELPSGIIQFGGRGSLFKIYRIFQSLQSAITVKRWSIGQKGNN
jgi:GT2 family glycosyltransferase